MTYYAEHRDEILAQKRQRRASGVALQDMEKKRAHDRAAGLANRPLRNKRVAEWRARNPDKHAATQGRLRAAKLGASPAWRNKFFIDEAYNLAARRTAATGVEWHVDHIVPLNGVGVRGLHVEHNLRVIPAKLNLQKGNRCV